MATDVRQGMTGRTRARGTRVAGIAIMLLGVGAGLLPAGKSISSDMIGGLLFDPRRLTYFDSDHFVQPRSKKYIKRADGAIRQLDAYDWIVFTSTNAVEHFLLRLSACGLDARAIRGSICAIGPATRAALEAAHLRADLVPDEAIAEGVAAAFGSHDLSSKRVLLPRAAEAREVIPQALTAMGARVDIADAYRNVIPADAAARIEECLSSKRGFDWITFTSGSTVKNWLSLAGRESLEGVRIASIGPATSEVIRKHGLEVTAEADPHTIAGLVEAVKAKLL